MQINELQIACGFLTFMGLDERKHIIESGITLKKLYNRYGDKIKKENVCSTMKWLDENPDVSVWHYGEKDYPFSDESGYRLPYNLFCRGKRSNLRKIAIIGTRFPSYNALKKAFIFGIESNLNGFRVVSGIAEGCDQAALSGSIEAAKKGYGIAGVTVLPCGHSVDYPSNSLGLKNDLLEYGGLIISEFPPLMPALKYNFLYRNLLIASICHSLVDIQSPLKSGANQTFDLACDMGRDVYVSDEGCSDNEVSMGSFAYHRDGCMSVSSLIEIFDDAVYQVKDCDSESKWFFNYGNSFYVLEKVYKN